MRLGINGRFLAAPSTGVQRFALEVTRRLASRRGVTVFLPRGVEWPRDLLAPLRVSRGSLGGPVWEQLELPRRARSEDMSVVLHPASSAPLVGGPHVVVLHDVLPLARPDDFTLRYRVWTSWTHVRAAKRAAAVVTVSDWSAQEIARRCGIPRGRVSVVEQAPGPLDAPASPAEVQAMRARRGLREPYVVAVVGSDPRKGATFLERTWSEWPVSDPRPALVLVGRNAGSVHRAAPHDHTVAGVHRAGAVQDAELRALYTGAAALLHPSEAEGFGRPPLEALACGTRVLAAPYGPARSVLGTAADYVERDAAGWRAAIANVLREPSEVRAERIARGRAWAARFDWNRTVDRIWAVCESAATSGTRGRA
jgi:glycosyltransferase involved in cell wall biosynthesis